MGAKRWGHPENRVLAWISKTHLYPSSGALDGGFHFNVSDGEHTSPGHFFRVMAQKQLFLSLEGSQTLTVCPGGSAEYG